MKKTTVLLVSVTLAALAMPNGRSATYPSTSILAEQALSPRQGEQEGPASRQNSSRGHAVPAKKLTRKPLPNIRRSSGPGSGFDQPANPPGRATSDGNPKNNSNPASGSHYRPPVQLPVARKDARATPFRHLGANDPVIGGASSKNGNGGAINGSHVKRQP